MKIIKNGIIYGGTFNNASDVITENGNLQMELDNKVPSTRKINGIAISNQSMVNITLDDLNIKTDILKTGTQGGSEETTINDCLTWAPIRFNMVASMPTVSLQNNQCWYDPMTGKVDIFFRLTSSSGIAANTAICALPADMLPIKPSANIKNEGPTWINNAASYCGYAQLTTAGVVTQQATSSCTSLACSFSYYTTPHLVRGEIINI